MQCSPTEQNLLRSLLAVAGAGAAALFSGGMTIVAFSVPLEKRAIYIATLSSMFGISSVIGPILGGALTDRASWRWCFWINLPFGAVAVATVFFFFKNPQRRYSDMSLKEKIKEIDIYGAMFLIGAIVCLLLALQWGGTTYPWKHSKVWGKWLVPFPVVKDPCRLFRRMLMVLIIDRLSSWIRTTSPSICLSSTLPRG
jgi:MFS family permease